MVVRFGSVRWLHRAHRHNADDPVLDGGVSTWDEDAYALRWTKIDDLPSARIHAGQAFVSAARDAARDEPRAWAEPLRECLLTLSGKTPYQVLFTYGHTLTQADGPLHDEVFARIRAVARRPDGSTAWRAVTLPDPVPTPESLALLAETIAGLRDDPLPARAGSSRAPAGEHPVLLRGEAACYTVHELLGHLLEWSPVNESRLERLGCLSPRITFEDDPTAPSYIRYMRDTEDTRPRGAVKLVDHGRVTGFLRDRAAARAGGMPTGHGRRQDYCHPPLVRMAAPRLAAGTDDLTDLGHHIVVDRIDQGRAFAERGQIELDAPRAEVNTPTMPTAAAGPTTFTVNLDHALTTGLLGVGRNTTTSVHLCRKHGQDVNVSVTAPDILVMARTH